MTIPPKKYDIVIGVHKGNTWTDVQVPRGKASVGMKAEALALLKKILVATLLVTLATGCQGLPPADGARQAALISALASNPNTWPSLDAALAGHTEPCEATAPTCMDPRVRADLLELTELLIGTLPDDDGLWSTIYRIVSDLLGPRVTPPPVPFAASEVTDLIGRCCAVLPDGSCYAPEDLRFPSIDHLDGLERQLAELAIKHADSVTAWLAERCYLGNCKPRGPIAGELQIEVYAGGPPIKSDRQLIERAKIRWFSLLIEQLSKDRSGVYVFRWPKNRHLGRPFDYEYHVRASSGPGVLLIAALSAVGAWDGEDYSPWWGR